MHRIILSLVVAFSLALAGCGPQLRALTTSVENPISGIDIYRVKNTYAAALELAVEYRNYCWARPYAVLMADPVGGPVCRSRRGVVRLIQKAQRQAKAAIITADKFVAENPTISAASAIGAAWKAVGDFKNAIPAVR